MEDEMEITLEDVVSNRVWATDEEIVKLLAELASLRNQVVEIHTMIACKECRHGVRPRNAVRGYCPGCAEKLLDVTDKLLDACNEIMEEIPECPQHGNQCVPHAREWIREMRGIEKAVRRYGSAGYYRLTSQAMHRGGPMVTTLPDLMDAIADSLKKHD